MRNPEGMDTWEHLDWIFIIYTWRIYHFDLEFGDGDGNYSYLRLWEVRFCVISCTSLNYQIDNQCGRPVPV